ncbi:cytochrome d ubiquinol oxidase subunit II [Edaphobacter albus]|uniref:cytochrome d ubiquinol oxidase subunit II n=1 Tax=Edaphobacter sp. 4G125 TaxID=2763071 RepID=UPI001646545F|nr:cytochrome d ubiquinol oxidase subunit II [Edaphobacter sp. 4G125]QNI35599.1 cytochrome d ubiquinol oxidase subunit II [Edaphobacter sp. 4G125]
MGTLWFWIVAAMLTVYVVLDGFDLGVGIVYPFVARTEQEKRQAMHAIGPVWDGNEVWLIAGGGTLFFAFPLLYASSFSGFYLPLTIVLWLLIVRGLSIEMRSHTHDSVYKTFFDATFFLSSALLAVFFGAALANVIRGVPLGADDYFFLPLWTDWRTGPNPGILDWYTVLGGVLALLALALHGLLYLALKTTGDLNARSSAWARRLWPVIAVITAASVPATVIARPDSLVHYQEHGFAWLAPAMVVVSLATIMLSLAKRWEWRAFLGSCFYLASMLVGAAAGLYPVLLPTVGSEGHDITIARALAGPHTVRVGLVWWTFGILLAVLYSATVYWLFRGKVPEHTEGYGH